MARYNKSTKVVFTEEYGGFKIEYLKYKNLLFIDVVIKETNTGHFMSDFLSEFGNTNDLIEELMPALEQVIGMDAPNEVICVEGSCAYIEKQKTYFINSDNLTLGKQLAEEKPEMYVTTECFKVIVEKWYDFLVKYSNLPLS